MHDHTFNRLIFEYFKDRWVFEKLSGQTAPSYVTPGEVANHIMLKYPIDFASQFHCMSLILDNYRQLNWAQLLHKRNMDRQYSSYSLSLLACSWLKSYPDLVERMVIRSSDIGVSQGRPDVYELNRARDSKMGIPDDILEILGLNND